MTDDSTYGFVDSLANQVQNSWGVPVNASGNRLGNWLKQTPLRTAISGANTFLENTNPLIAGLTVGTTAGIAALGAGWAKDQITDRRDTGTGRRWALPSALTFGILASVLSGGRHHRQYYDALREKAQSNPEFRQQMMDKFGSDDKTHLRNIVRSSNAPFQAKSSLQSAISGLSQQDARRIRQAVGFTGTAAAVAIIARNLAGMGIIPASVLALIAGVGGAAMFGGSSAPRPYRGMPGFQTQGFF